MKVYEIITEDNVVNAASAMLGSNYGGVAMVVVGKLMSMSYSASTSYPPSLAAKMNSKWANIPVGLSGMLTHAGMLSIILDWYLRTSELESMRDSGKISKDDYDIAYRLLGERTVLIIAGSAAFKLFIKMIADMIAKKQLQSLKSTNLFAKSWVGTSIMLAGNITAAAFLAWANTEAGTKTLAAFVMKTVDPAGISLWNQFVVPFTGGEKAVAPTPAAQDALAQVDFGTARDKAKDAPTSTKRMPGQLPGGQLRGTPPTKDSVFSVDQSKDHIGYKVSKLDPNLGMKSK